jgi:hypothetical protein
MWPALRSGDEAGFAPLGQLPSPGEVLIARIPGAIVIHRVTRVDAAGVISLRGDNCAHEDPPVRLADTLGRVEVVRRRGRELRGAAWDCGPRLLGALKVRLGGRLRRLLGRVA